MTKWLIFNSVTLFVAAYLYQYYDALNWLLTNDKTHISLLILLSYALTSGYLLKIKSSTVGFVTNTLMGLGLIGTVIGMMEIFSSLNTTDVKQVIPQLMHGIATAQITTLFGLGSALLLSVQSFFVLGSEGSEK